MLVYVHAIMHLMDKFSNVDYEQANVDSDSQDTD